MMAMAMETSQMASGVHEVRYSRRYLRKCIGRHADIISDDFQEFRGLIFRYFHVFSWISRTDFQVFSGIFLTIFAPKSILCSTGRLNLFGKTLPQAFSATAGIDVSIVAVQLSKENIVTSASDMSTRARTLDTNQQKWTRELRHSKKLASASEKSTRSYNSTQINRNEHASSNIRRNLHLQQEWAHELRLSLQISRNEHASWDIRRNLYRHRK